MMTRIEIRTNGYRAMDGSRWHTARTPCSNRAKNSGGRSRSHIGSRLAPRLFPSASRDWSGRVSKPEVDKLIAGSLPLAERHSSAHPASLPEIQNCAEVSVILNRFDNPNCRRPWEVSSVLDSLRRGTARKGPESTPSVALDRRKMDVPPFISGTGSVCCGGQVVALGFENLAREHTPGFRLRPPAKRGVLCLENLESALERPVDRHVKTCARKEGDS